MEVLMGGSEAGGAKKTSLKRSVLLVVTVDMARAVKGTVDGIIRVAVRVSIWGSLVVGRCLLSQ